MRCSRAAAMQATAEIARLATNGIEGIALLRALAPPPAPARRSARAASNEGDSVEAVMAAPAARSSGRSKAGRRRPSRRAGAPRHLAKAIERVGRGGARGQSAAGSAGPIAGRSRTARDRARSCPPCADVPRGTSDRLAAQPLADHVELIERRIMPASSRRRRRHARSAPSGRAYRRAAVRARRYPHSRRRSAATHVRSRTSRAAPGLAARASCSVSRTESPRRITSRASASGIVRRDQRARMPHRQRTRRHRRRAPARAVRAAAADWRYGCATC